MKCRRSAVEFLIATTFDSSAMERSSSSDMSMPVPGGQLGIRGYVRARVRAAAGNQRHLAAQLAPDDLHELLALGRGDREPLALRAADDDAVHSLFQQPLQQPLHGIEVKCPVT